MKMATCGPSLKARNFLNTEKTNNTTKGKDMEKEILQQVIRKAATAERLLIGCRDRGNGSTRAAFTYEVELKTLIEVIRMMGGDASDFEWVYNL